MAPSCNFDRNLCVGPYGCWNLDPVVFLRHSNTYTYTRALCLWHGLTLKIDVRSCVCLKDKHRPSRGAELNSSLQAERTPPAAAAAWRGLDLVLPQTCRPWPWTCRAVWLYGYRPRRLNFLSPRTWQACMHPGAACTAAHTHPEPCACDATGESSIRSAPRRSWQGMGDDEPHRTGSTGTTAQQGLLLTSVETDA